MPEVVSIQGRLRDSAGRAVADGDYDVTFRIYDAEGALVSDAIWEDAVTVATADGLFAVLLGHDTAALDLPFDAQYWLGVQVADDDEEMAPRFRLAAAPYAIRAKSADAVGGKAVSDLADAAHTHSSLVSEETLTEAVVVDASGNVGVGTPTPTATLDVDGAARVGGLTVSGSLDLEDTNNIRSYTVGPLDFNKDVSGAGSFVIGDYRYIAPTAAGYAWAPVHLPDGAVLTEMEATVSDQTDTGHVEVDLGLLGVWFAHIETTDAQTGGQTTLSDTGVNGYTIDGSRRYCLRAHFSANAMLYVNRVTIRYYMPQLP